MGYRDRSTKEKSGEYNYCIMEVRLRKKNAAEGAKDEFKYMTVDSHWDTLKFVEENINECVGNVVRLKRADEAAQRGVNESAQLFQRNLEPLVSTLAASQQHGQGVMDKLSSSLKKALLLMVMERYQSDRETACRVLGISREKLDSELRLCGVTR